MGFEVSSLGVTWPPVEITLTLLSILLGGMLCSSARDNLLFNMNTDDLIRTLLCINQECYTSILMYKTSSLDLNATH